MMLQHDATWMYMIISAVISIIFVLAIAVCGQECLGAYLVLQQLFAIAIVDIVTIEGDDTDFVPLSWGIIPCCPK